MSDNKVALLSQGELLALMQDAAESAAAKLGIQKDPCSWSYEQCAEYLGCKRSHLTELVKLNAIPHFKVGKLVRFHPHEIRQWPGISPEELKELKDNEIMKRIRPGRAMG